MHGETKYSFKFTRDVVKIPCGHCPAEVNLIRRYKIRRVGRPVEKAEGIRGLRVDKSIPSIDWAVLERRGRSEQGEREGSLNEERDLHRELKRSTVKHLKGVGPADGRMKVGRIQFNSSSIRVRAGPLGPM
jgi:hypothetical protein